MNQFYADTTTDSKRCFRLDELGRIQKKKNYKALHRTQKTATSLSYESTLK